MLLMLIGTYIILFVTGPIAIYVGVDPLSELFGNQDEYGVVGKISLILVRLVIFLIALLEIAKSSNALFIVTLLGICSINDVLSDLSRAARIRRILGGFKEIKLYRELFIWNKYTNQNFCSFEAPPLIFFGSGVIVLTYYGTIRMYGKMAVLPYLINPITWVLATFFLVLLVPHAANCWEYANTFLRQKRNCCDLLKAQRKVWKSMRPLNIQVGPFGVIRRGLKSLVIKYIVDNTITLLLAF